MFSVAGCMSNNTPSKDGETSQEEQQEIRQGLVERSTMGVNKKGTHTLTQSNGQELFLKSKTENLNLYIDETVEVRGLISTDEDGDEIMDVVSIKRAGDDQQAEKDVEWVTDTFNELGIRISYPDLLQAFANSSALSFSYSNKDEEGKEEKVQITITEDGRLGSKDLKAYLSQEHRGTVYEEIRLGSYSGFRKKSDISTTMELYISNEGIVYRIDFMEEGSTQNWKKHFYQMMDSLTFGVKEDLPSEVQEDKDSSGEDEGDRPSASTSTSTSTSARTESTSSSTNSSTSTSASTAKPAATAPAASIGTNAQQKVATYISTNVGSLHLGDNIRISGYSFVEPNYVYVTYADGDARKKVLYQYTVSGSTVSTTQVGTFVAGETRSWEKVEGDNPVANKEQQVYAVDDGEIKETATVKPGFRLFESSNQNYMIQIPASWYYQGAGGALNFSNQPVDETNVKSSLKVQSTSIGSVEGNGTTIGGKDGKVSYGTDASGAQTVTVSVQGADGKVYSVTGAAAEEATYKAMLETLQTK